MQDIENMAKVYRIVPMAGQHFSMLKKAKKISAALGEKARARALIFIICF